MKRNLPQGKTSFLDNHDFVMTTLTPVHIGSGFKLYKGLDFETDREETRILDVNKVFSLAMDDGDLSTIVLQNRLISYAQSKQINLDSVTKWKFDASCKSQEILDNMRNSNDEPYIPGSSIKGSTRTILFTDMYQREKNKYKNIQVYNAKGKPTGRFLEPAVLASGAFKPSLAPNYDAGRIFRPSDAIFDKSSLSIINIFIVNVVKNNGRDELLFKSANGNTPLIHESNILSVLGINENSKSMPFRISFDKNISSIKEMSKYNLTPSKIASMSNRWSLDILNKEYTFWSKYLKTWSEELVDMAESSLDEIVRIQKIINTTQESNENGSCAWVQRIGWGSGFTSLTGGYMDDDFTLEVRDKIFKRKDFDFFPKSRRVSDRYDMPMGWVKVELKS